MWVTRMKRRCRTFDASKREEEGEEEEEKDKEDKEGDREEERIEGNLITFR